MLDLVVVNLDAQIVSVFLGNGRGGFSPAPESPFATGGGDPFSVGAGDFNGDGKPDLAVANNFTDDVSLLVNELVVRGDFKNAPEFCKAKRTSVGDEAFSQRYGTNHNGANAFGRCVRENR